MGHAMYIYAQSQTVGYVQGVLSWEEGMPEHYWGCMCTYMHMYVDVRGKPQVCVVPQRLSTLFIETGSLTEARAYGVG